MDSFVLHYLTLWRPLGYLLTFLGLLFEGEAVIFTAAFLTHRGFFDGGDIFFVIIAGVITGDILWYLAGCVFLDGRHA